MKVYSHILLQLQLTAGYYSTYTAAEPITCNSNVDTCDVSTPLVVESYDIYNGSKDDYVDDKYPGGPDNAQVQLVDGQGDLTDGIIPQISWRSGDPVRSGPFVGYLRSSLPGSLSTNNAIPFDFMFTQDETVSKVEISVDDPLPEFSGGVTAPGKVIIGGTEYNFPPNPDGAQTGPYTATIELTEPVYVSMGSPLNIQLIPVPTENRQCRETGVDKICVWVFASEFKFFEPCSALLLACKEEERAKCCYKTAKRIQTIPLSHQNPNILANELLPLYILSIFFTSIQGVTFFFNGFHCPGCFANKVFTVFENSFQSALGSGSSSDGLLSTSNRLQYSLNSS